MYLHLGSDEMLPIEEIVAILNIEAPISESVKEIIELASIEKTLKPICKKERAKSLVITSSSVYLSPISSITLFKRSNSDYREA
ncbi:MAG: extracellular matrix regulator RemB [Chitinophagales bacterium]